MYDSLDKTGLKAVLEAIKGKMPTSLPANGGNADTLNGMSAETIRSMSKNVESGTSVSSQLADGTYCGVWSDAPSGLADTQGTLVVSNYNTNGAPSPWSHRTFYSPHYNIIWHGFTANYNWYGWKEISTTPIKSTNISGVTDQYGNLLLWTVTDTDARKPILVTINGFYVIPFLTANSEHFYYYAGLINCATHEYIPNTSVSGTVYYIEV